MARNSGKRTTNSRIDTVRLAWLQAFLAVVEYGSFTEAAKVMGIHQSMVSRYVQDFGIWLRKPLFDSIVPIELSKWGEEVRPVALQVCQLLLGIRGLGPEDIPKVNPADIDFSSLTPEVRTMLEQRGLRLPKL